MPVGAKHPRQDIDSPSAERKPDSANAAGRPRIKERVLVVDDEPGMCHILNRLLTREGYEVETTSSGAEALQMEDKQEFDAAMLDLRMPGMSGLELLTALRQRDADIEVVIMTAFATVETAVEAMSLGARSYIRKPFNNDEVLLTLRNALEHRRLINRNRYLSEEIERRYGLGGMVGSSKVMQDLYRFIERVAQTDSTILILGESGTGKELVARAIHQTSPRREDRFVPVNCGALPRDLIESELFGHEKGAFSGAHVKKIGLIEAAGAGTLFLDEIGDLPLELQVKVLRVLETKEVRRIGSTVSRKIDVRILAATNSDLHEMVREGAFREDLYYRLSILPIQLPPLRNRREDIQELTEHFIQDGNQRFNRVVDCLTPEALRALSEYDWPGNVRELENTIERCMVLCDGTEISASDLPPLGRSIREIPSHTFVNPRIFGFSQAREAFERTYLKALLEVNDGNVTRSAAMADLSRRYLQELMKKYELR